MKKLMLFAFALLAMVSCQKSAEQANVAEKDAQATLVNPSVSNWELAQRLAAYGYDNESAGALVEAADILVSIPVVAAEIGKEDPKGEAPTEVKAEKAQISVEKLLADAADFTEDAAIMARIEAIKSRQAMMAEMEGTRGAVGGAQVLSDMVYSNGEQMFFCDFYAHQVAMVALVGDGDSDLDLFIYDQNMNLVTEDAGYDFDCLCTWTPAWTGRFYMKVVNRGNVYNRFTLATN